MRFLFLLLVASSSFAQTCDDIVKSYDTKETSLTIPYNEFELGRYLTYKLLIIPQRSINAQYDATVVTFVMSRLFAAGKKDGKGIRIVFEDGSEMNIPEIAYSVAKGSNTRYVASIVITPENRTDFTTKKIREVTMAGKTEKADPEKAAAVVFYLNCLLSYTNN